MDNSLLEKRTLGHHAKRARDFIMEESSGDSDFSLPCLSSDEDVNKMELFAPHARRGSSYTFDASTRSVSKDEEARELGSSPSSLPCSSPVITPQPEDTSLAIRPFPLEHLLHSPEFLVQDDTAGSDQEEPGPSINALPVTMQDAEPPVPPETLCPWCDDPLPTYPSLELRARINQARHLSVSQPTLENPLARSLSVAALTSVCHLHERELERELNPDMYDPPPEGFPAFIDWSTLPERTISLQDHLRRIIDDVDEQWRKPSARQRSVRRLREYPDQLMLHPRTESYFWKAITNDIIVHGLQYFETMSGQMNALNRTRPGYFGEIGSYILESSLVKLFPNSIFQPGLTSPLSASNFRTYVLLPEVAVHLIMGDLGQNRTSAIRTMLRSITFGNSQFPLNQRHESEYDRMISGVFRELHNARPRGSHHGRSGPNDMPSSQRVCEIGFVRHQPADSTEVESAGASEGSRERKRVKIDQELHDE